jgi:hypothetical protein
MSDTPATPRENYEWFEENLPGLEKKYKDLYAVIKDRQVIASYGSQREAFADMKRKEKPGTFIIQLCSTDIEPECFLF